MILFFCNITNLASIFLILRTILFNSAKIYVNCVQYEKLRERRFNFIVSKLHEKF